MSQDRKPESLSTRSRSRSRSELGGGSRSAFVPLAGLFLVGGLWVGGSGLRHYREGVALPRRSEAIAASDLQTTNPGDSIVVTGRISEEASEVRGPVLYDEYVNRIRPKEGDVWELAGSSHPRFTLSQGSGSTTVLEGGYSLVRPPQRWTEGNRRYEGFRAGDLATALGSVTAERDRRVLKARLVFGGTVSQLSQSIQRDALLSLAVGFAAVLVGCFFLGGTRWRRPHAPPAWRRPRPAGRS